MWFLRCWLFWVNFGYLGFDLLVCCLLFGGVRLFYCFFCVCGYYWVCAWLVDFGLLGWVVLLMDVDYVGFVVVWFGMFWLVLGVGWVLDGWWGFGFGFYWLLWVVGVWLWIGYMFLIWLFYMILQLLVVCLFVVCCGFV